MFKVLCLILGLEGQSLKYSVMKHSAYLHYILCTVASTRMFIFAGFIFFGGVKQNLQIRQCLHATSEAASVTRKLYVLERFLCFLHQFYRAFVSQVRCLGL